MLITPCCVCGFGENTLPKPMYSDVYSRSDLLRSTQKFPRRDVDGGGGGATRPSAALVPSALATHRLLRRCSRAARSESRASARSQRCCGLRPQRPLAARPSAALVCSLASPGRHVRCAQKLCSPWGRLILRRAQNSN